MIGSYRLRQVPPTAILPMLPYTLATTTRTLLELGLLELTNLRLETRDDLLLLEVLVDQLSKLDLILLLDPLGLLLDDLLGEVDLVW